MKFSLRAESPIHVGTGESLSWLDYVLIGKTVHVLDWGALMDAALLGTEEAADRLLAFTDRCAKILRKAQDALPKAPGRERSELLRKAREETSVLLFAKEDLGNEVLARGIQAGDFDRYRCEYLGGRLDRRLEIRVQAKDARSQPTVPASSLRGQLRTALAHAVLAAGDEEVAKLILEGGGGVDGWNRGLAEATPGRARFLFGDEIEAAVFRASSGTQRNARQNDPRNDVLRFLRISDPLRSRAGLVVLRSSPFGLTRSGGGRPDSARVLPLQPTVLEAIEEGSEFDYDFQVDVATLRGAAAATGSAHPLVREPFWNLFHRVFGVSRDEVSSLSDAALEDRVFSAIEVSLAARMSALVARERAWFDRMSAPKDAPLRGFVDSVAASGPDRLPMRIGFGSGLHSLTVLPAIESDASLAEPLSRALARAGLGLKPRERRERAEREKSAIEQARREAADRSGPRPGLREELVGQTRDPKILPVTRRFTMEGGGPDLYLGFASLARGVMAETPPEPRRRAARERPEERRPERRSDRRPERRPERRDRKPQRPPIPDRPANESEIENLLKKFGPRH